MPLPLTDPDTTPPVPRTFGEYRDVAGRLPQVMYLGDALLADSPSLQPNGLTQHGGALWTANLEAGDMSEWNANFGLQVVRTRGVNNHYSILVKGSTANTYAYGSLPVGAPNNNAGLNFRFYIACDPNARWAPDAVITLFKIGGNPYPYEIIVFNPSDVPQRPRLGYRISGKLVWTAARGLSVVPRYYEFMMGSVPNIPAGPTVSENGVNTNLTVAQPAATFDTILLGAQDVVGPYQDTGIYVSRVAAQADPSAWIHSNMNANIPDIKKIDLDRGTRHTVSANRIWSFFSNKPSRDVYGTEHPPSLYGENVYNFYDEQYQVNYTDVSWVPFQQPIAVGGLVTAIMIGTGEMLFSTVDAETGMPLGTLHLTGYVPLSQYNFVPVDDGFLIACTDNVGNNVWVCYDPFVGVVRWTQKLDTTVVQDMIPWAVEIPLPTSASAQPIGTPTLLRLSVSGTTATLDLLTAALLPVLTVTWTVTSGQGPKRILAADDYGQVILQYGDGITTDFMVVNLTKTLQAAEQDGSFTRVAPEAGNSALVTIGIAAKYPLTPSTNPTAVRSSLRDVVSITSDNSRLAVVLAAPSYVSNNNPQGISVQHYNWYPDVVGQLFALGTSALPKVWNSESAIANNTDALTPIELGSVQTDSANNTYVTFRFQDSQGLRRWNLAAFDQNGLQYTINGRLTTAYQPIADPGGPAPAPIGGLSRLIVINEDYYTLEIENLPAHYWPLTEGGTNVFDYVSGVQLWQVGGSKARTSPMLPNTDLEYGHNLYGITPSSVSFSAPANSFTVETLIRQIGAIPAGGMVLFGWDSASSTFQIWINADGSVSVKCGTTSLQTVTINTGVFGAGGSITGYPQHIEFRVDGPNLQVQMLIDGGIAGTAFLTNVPAAVAPPGVTGVFLGVGCSAHYDGTNWTPQNFITGTGTLDLQHFAVYHPARANTLSQANAGFLFNGPSLTEGWLDYNQWYAVMDTISPINDSIASKSSSKLSPYRRVPLPMIPAALNPGGVVEIFEKQPNGEFERLAFASDLTSGLTRTRDLTQVESINFTIAFDRFTPEAGGRGADFLSNLQRTWQQEHSEELGSQLGPYDKASKVRDHVYLGYTEPDGRKFLWRVMTLDDQDETQLSGTAASQAIELADMLTQYVAGRSEFSGVLPSTVGQRILDGDQSIILPNRKFARDRSPSMTAATDIPSMIPSSYNSTFPNMSSPQTALAGPQPYTVIVPSAVPSDAESFSGNPAETIPPQGTTRNLQSGFVGYHGFSDGDLNVAGGFQKVVNDGEQSLNGAILMPAPINYSANGWGFDIAYGEGYNQNKPVTRIVYGGIYAPVDGVYTFQLQAQGGAKMFFQGVPIVDMWFLEIPSSGTIATSQSVALKGGRWYPFVIWHSGTGGTNYNQWLRLYWEKPGDTSFALIPAANLTHQLHGGLFIVKFFDSGSSPSGGTSVLPAVRFMTAYKNWDGRSIVLGYALPQTYMQNLYQDVDYTSLVAKPPPASNWTAGASAGTLIEECIFPWNDSYQPTDWGSGWTRRPAPTLQGIPAVVPAPVSFTPAKGY